MTKARVLVQFDGANFYKKMKYMSPGISTSRFNYQKLATSVCNSSNPRVVYYVGEIRKNISNPKSIQLYNNQQSLFELLRAQSIVIKLGYLLYSSSGWHEKGVDVQIAVDLVDGAADDIYDIAYLVSSDTDLIPAIKAAQRRDKRIVYVAFAGNISHGLKYICDKTLILKPGMLV